MDLLRMMGVGAEPATQTLRAEDAPPRDAFERFLDGALEEARPPENHGDGASEKPHVAEAEEDPRHPEAEDTEANGAAQAEPAAPADEQETDTAMEAGAGDSETTDGAMTEALAEAALAGPVDETVLVQLGATEGEPATVPVGPAPAMPTESELDGGASNESAKALETGKVLEGATAELAAEFVPTTSGGEETGSVETLDGAKKLEAGGPATEQAAQAADAAQSPAPPETGEEVRTLTPAPDPRPEAPRQQPSAPIPVAHAESERAATADRQPTPSEIPTPIAGEPAARATSAQPAQPMQPAPAARATSAEVVPSRADAANEIAASSAHGGQDIAVEELPPEPRETIQPRPLDASIEELAFRAGPRELSGTGVAELPAEREVATVMRELPVERLAEQTIRFAEGMRRDGSSFYRASLRLSPPELGRLQIEMRLEGDQVWTRFVVESAAARDQIELELSRLKAALSERGLGDARVEVQIGQSGAQDRGGDFESPEDADWAERGERAEESGELLRFSRTGLHDGLIDLRA